MDPISAIFSGLLFILLALIVILGIVALFRSIRQIRQGTTGIVERFGRFHRVLNPGLNFVIPFMERVFIVDMREQVRSFPPQPVITEDNLVVSIDTVVYFQVTDPRAATYEIANYLEAVEQLTTTTLRNVVGGMNLEEALTSRDTINGQLRIVLDQATGKWGLRVSRVELKAIEPTASMQDTMEQQARAERTRRAVVTNALGTKESQIREAEGMRESEILRAQGDAKSQVLRAQAEAQAQVLRAKGDAEAQVLLAKGESEAIERVFDAIHAGDADEKLLAYQYLQTLPKLADGQSSKLWIIPSELTEALGGLSQGFSTPRDQTPYERKHFDDSDRESVLDTELNFDAESGISQPVALEDGIDADDTQRRPRRVVDPAEILEQAGLAPEPTDAPPVQSAPQALPNDPGSPSAPGYPAGPGQQGTNPLA